ncbi:hypothetical protein KEJ18_06935 [Candidatus Bathyarchaeota archaeon]|nr:hypothetical protein [Candidatus Bathyarchaeota archaeon]
MSPALWLAGGALAGREKAKFTDAVAIIVVGIIVGAIFDAFVLGFFELLFSMLPLGALGFWLFSYLIRLIIWLALVKHYFDCGWLKALAISILAIILFAIIAVVLAFLGLALIALI